jgi:hypothetical protein
MKTQDQNTQVMIEILANLAALNQNLKEFQKSIDNGFNNANEIIK